MQEVTIRRDDAGQRLDRFLRKLLPGSTLGNVYRVLRKGRVRVNGRRAEGDLRLAEGDRVEVRIGGPADGSGAPAARPDARPDPQAARARAAAGKLRILHRDEHVLAVDKPPFLLVQPGEGAADASLDATLDAIVRELAGPGESLTFRPALAHRLDRGTSGVVLFGLTAEGLRGLTELFRRREVEKTYLALVEGSPEQDAFSVDLPLARDPSDESRGKRVKESRGEGAQEAHTDFVVRARDEERRLALVEARPRTGRTHQIRAHLRAVRLPIAGDPTYGDPRTRAAWAAKGLRRQFLHAWRIALPHPADPSRRLEVEAPLPPDLVRALRGTTLAHAVPKPDGPRAGR